MVNDAVLVDRLPLRLEDDLLAAKAAAFAAELEGPEGIRRIAQALQTVVLIAQEAELFAGRYLGELCAQGVGVDQAVQ